MPPDRHGDDSASLRRNGHLSRVRADSCTRGRRERRPRRRSDHGFAVMRAGTTLAEATPRRPRCPDEIEQVEAGRERAGRLLDERTRGAARVGADARSRRAAPTTLTPPRVTKFVDAKRPESDAARGRRRRSGADDRRRRQADRRQGGRLRGRGAGRGGAGGRPPVHVRARAQGRPRRSRRASAIATPSIPRPSPPRRARRRGAGAAAAPPRRRPKRRPAPAGSKVASCRRGGDKPVAAATVTLLSDAGRRRRNDAGRRGRHVRVRRRRPRVLPRAHRGGRLRRRRDARGGDVRRGHRDHLPPGTGARRADTQYEFGATASIAAPPREVVKRTLAPEELVRAAGTRGDPLRVIELLPGVARPPGLAGFIIIRGALAVRLAGVLRGRAGRPHLPLRRADQLRQPAPARSHRPLPGELLGPLRPQDGRHHRRRHPRSQDRRVSRHGRRQPDRRVLHRRGSGRQARRRSPSPRKRSYIDFWFNNVVPADAIGVTAAPVYYDYQAIYTYRPESGGKVRTMFFGSGDEFRLNLKQPADGDPTLRGTLGQGTSFRRLQTIWQRSLGAHVEQEITAGVGTIAQDLSVGSTLGFSFNGFDQFLRAEWRAQLGSHVKLIGGFDGYAVELDVSLRRADLSVHGGKPALLLRPAHRPADGDVQGPVPQLPPRRLPRGADPGGRAADAGARRARRLLQRDREGLGQPAADRALQAGAADDAEGRRGPVLAAAASTARPSPRSATRTWASARRSTTASASSSASAPSAASASRASTSASPISRSTASAPTATRCW